MATIFELARNLGEELAKTPQVEALMEAKAAYESDSTISSEVEEYTKLHQEFETKMRAGGISAEEQKDFHTKMNEMGESIKNNPLAANLFSAESNFNNYMNSVFSIITSTMSGEDQQAAGGCSPSACSGCGGGCGCGM